MTRCEHNSDEQEERPEQFRPQVFGPVDERDALKRRVLRKPDEDPFPSLGLRAQHAPVPVEFFLCH